MYRFLAHYQHSVQKSFRGHTQTLVLLITLYWYNKQSPSSPSSHSSAWTPRGPHHTDAQLRSMQPCGLLWSICARQTDLDHICCKVLDQFCWLQHESPISLVTQLHRAGRWRRSWDRAIAHDNVNQRPFGSASYTLNPAIHILCPCCSDWSRCCRILP